MKSDGLHRQQYWNYRFDNSYEGIKTERLKVELSELLVESIQRRTQDGAGIAISLSAGYDSTTILGVLRYILQMDSVQCFSFVRGNEPSKDGDAYRSHEMAKLAGYEHRMIQGYGGDLLKWIMLNGTMGNGIAGTNAEIDAMQELFQQSNNNHIRRVFMGDECFGCSPYKLKSHSDVFNVLDLRAGSEVPYLSELMDEGMCQRLGEGIAKDMEEIVANHNESYNLYDLEGYLHLDQYVSNYLLPNKEYFMGNFVFVENPFLDNAILDFMKKIPVSLRLDRRLYKDTVSEMFPQLFTIKRANSTEYYTDWEKEFLKYQKEIESSLLSQKSILDELIPPEKIIKFMRNGLSSKTLLMTRGWSKVKSNGYRVVNAFGKIIGSQRPPKINDTSHAEMLRRILVIRSFLNMTVDQNA
jgi:asparagine synthetase B (glutamine-hydrolysing)